MRLRLWLALLLAGLLAAPTQAGILFGRKKERPDPKKRVPELVAILKADKDGDKRARAAEELRHYDHAAFPEIIPTLIQAMQNDARPGVRVEAAQSLGRVRPVSQVVGDALEQALARDGSMRVRLQVRSQLLQYQLAGYRSGRKVEVPSINSTREPPLAKPDSYPPPVTTKPTAKEPPRATRPLLRPLPVQRPTSPPPMTREPPLAPPTGEGPELP